MQPRNKSLQTIEKIDFSVRMVESMNIMGIFIFFLSDVLKQAFIEIGRFIFFPMAMAISIIQAILSIKKAHITKDTNLILQAVLNTICAVATMIAVIGGIIASGIFGAFAPFILIGTLSLKCLFCMGSAAYYWHQSVIAQTPQDKAHYRGLAKANMVGVIALLLGIAAITAVMVFLKPFLAPVGVVSGAIGGGFSLYKKWTSLGSEPRLSEREESSNDLSSPSTESSLSGNARLYDAVGGKTTKSEVDLSTQNTEHQKQRDDSESSLRRESSTRMADDVPSSPAIFRPGPV